MDRLSTTVFTVDVSILTLLLVGALWSVAVPDRRIWPPPHKSSWQFVVTWVSFCSVFFLNAVLLVLDWDSWVFSSQLRLIVGIPLALIGGLLVSWGVTVLGVRNTAGLEDGLIATGAYRFTRNPQYLGDIVLFIGLSVVANSLLLWITHLLLILVFMAAPLAEEPWLEAKYGNPYEEYKRNTPRFL